MFYEICYFICSEQQHFFKNILQPKKNSQLDMNILLQLFLHMKSTLQNKNCIFFGDCLFLQISF